MNQISPTIRPYTVRGDLLFFSFVTRENPVEASFTAPVQTGAGAHPASCTMGTGSFLGVERPGRGVDPHPHLAPRLKKE